MATRKSAPLTVTLTRKQIEHILIDWMGWEDIDLKSFWREARKLQARPAVTAGLAGIVERFIETAEDYLPDGNDDPAYSPEATLLADAKAALAASQGGAS